MWLNQEQLVKLYNSSKSNISEHIKHILNEGELEENLTVRNFRTTDVLIYAVSIDYDLKVKIYIKELEKLEYKN